MARDSGASIYYKNRQPRKFWMEEKYMRKAYLLVLV